jgi:hypothetical protein
MPPINIILGLSHIFVGVLMIVVCIPLTKDRIGMNKLYGIRFKQSFESPENWYKINRYGGRRVIFWSKVLVAIGVLTLFLPLGEKGIVRLAFAPFIYIVPAIESWLFARKQ